MPFVVAAALVKYGCDKFGLDCTPEFAKPVINNIKRKAEMAKDLTEEGCELLPPCKKVKDFVSMSDLNPTPLDPLFCSWSGTTTRLTLQWNNSTKKAAIETKTGRTTKSSTLLMGMQITPTVQLRLYFKLVIKNYQLEELETNIEVVSGLDVWLRFYQELKLGKEGGKNFRMKQVLEKSLSTITLGVITIPTPVPIVIDIKALPKIGFEAEMMVNAALLVNVVPKITLKFGLRYTKDSGLRITEKDVIFDHKFDWQTQLGAEFKAGVALIFELRIMLYKLIGIQPEFKVGPMATLGVQYEKSSQQSVEAEKCKTTFSVDLVPSVSVSLGVAGWLKNLLSVVNPGGTLGEWDGVLLGPMTIWTTEIELFRKQLDNPLCPVQLPCATCSLVDSPREVCNIGMSSLQPMRLVRLL